MFAPTILIKMLFALRKATIILHFAFCTLHFYDNKIQKE